MFYKPVAETGGQHIILVKRVIGIPGDRIHLRHGIVYLNGVAQPEPFAATPTLSSYNAYVDDFPSIPPADLPEVTTAWAISLQELLQGDDLVVPSGQYFVMGDNRDHSLDSRFWGFVPRENIIGRPLFVYWSFDQPEIDELNPPLSEQFSLAANELLHFFDIRHAGTGRFIGCNRGSQQRGPSRRACCTSAQDGDASRRHSSGYSGTHRFEVPFPSTPPSVCLRDVQGRG